MSDASAAGPAQPALHGKHPPKPTLTLRVGVSGHRPKPTTFPAESFAFVRRRLDEVFLAIEKAVAELKHANRGFYAADAGGAIPHKLRLVSGLAEGADQMAVDARPPGWDLDAVLPFPREYFLADFAKSAVDDATDVSAGFTAALAKATTVVELPRDPRMPLTEPADEKERKEYWTMRNRGYARLGHFLLGQIDVLVALWDGKREDGPGGTAEVVRGALDAGIPVIWISTLRDTFPRRILDVDDDMRPVAPEADALTGPLKDAISTIVSVPAATPESGHGARNPSARVRLEHFFKETWPRSTRWVVYDLFKRFMEGRRLQWVITPPTQAAAASQLEPFIGDTPEEAGPLRERVRRVLSPRYGWADSLAVERSNRYRSAYIVCYLLAALLVAIALLGVFVHDVFEHSDATMLGAKAVLVLIELALIVYIFSIVRRGRRSRWQQTWVEYRALAEMMRSVPFLAYIGEHGYVQRSHDLEPASSAWFLWYLRATIREIGLPSAALGGTYQNKLLLAVEKHIIDDQVGYNRRTTSTLASMHHLLHVVGDRCFVLTGIVLGLFLLTYIVYLAGGLCDGRSLAQLTGWNQHDAPALSQVDLGGAFQWYEKVGRVLYSMKSSVTFFAALLPALGAAVFGIRETGDFEGFAKRAAQTAGKLQALKFGFARARRKLVLETTTAALLSTAQVLSEDLGAWQSVYGRKQLSLPA